MTGSVYSVGQVNAYIKNMFAQDFMMSRIAVSGEVSNCKYHSSGHIYFTLKDAAGVLSAVMFAGSRKRGLLFPMKAGDKVVALGSIRVYERDGRYQLYAEQILLQGSGLLYQRYEALKRELEEMGMFSPEYKQPIPQYASRIGVVTAPTGAAVQDIRNIARRRNPYVQLILYPAQVQGEGAAASVVNGIHALEERGMDVIIVRRGGGSIEDLRAFNEEIVARAIFECMVPVISAVGHETYTTIADYVADLRAPTPSAAAELAVFDIRRLLEQIDAGHLALNRALSDKLEQTAAKIRQYELRLQSLNPKTCLLENRHAAADYQDRIQNRLEQLITQNRHRRRLYASARDAQSTLKKLRGGYAYLARPDGHRLYAAAELAPGERIRAYMLDGSFSAVVEEVFPADSGSTAERSQRLS
ncbi:MAG: exodeoxyribonuclease VII large subunit [Lachnospiraceae bacterium]|nr:exodeoxyribonuclease VII large subunit [Lachnospiraceae bacterium]